jgi:hypothetical protein
MNGCGAIKCFKKPFEWAAAAAESQLHFTLV